MRDRTKEDQRPTSIGRPVSVIVAVIGRTHEEARPGSMVALPSGREERVDDPLSGWFDQLQKKNRVKQGQHTLWALMVVCGMCVLRYRCRWH